MSSIAENTRERLSAQGEYILGVSESLIKHPRFITYIGDIINYLQLGDKGWECLLHLRRDTRDSALLRQGHSDLFKVPNDIVNQVDTLRTGEKWDRYKDGILARFSVFAHNGGKLSLQIPESRPISLASTVGSTRSSLPPFSGSEESARSSVSSGHISDWSINDSAWAVNRGRRRWESTPTPRSVTPSPAAEAARRMIEPRKCPACDKLYKNNGNLIRHLKVEHPEHPAAQKHNSSDLIKVAFASPESCHNVKDSMPPPPRASSTSREVSQHPSATPSECFVETIAQTASMPVGQKSTRNLVRHFEERDTPGFEQPPPVPQKDPVKRPLPDSPTSQLGPREAMEPEQYRSDIALVDDNWSRCYNDELYQRLFDTLTTNGPIDLDQEGMFIT